MNFAFIDDLIDRARPHVETAGARAEMHAQRMTEHLHAIRRHAEAQRDVNIERMFFPDIIVPAGGGRVNVANVPSGAIWEMEAISTLLTTIVVYADASIRVVSGAASWGLQLQPVRFMGPCSVSVGQTGVSDGAVFLQFREIRCAPRPTVHAGQPETGVAAIQGRREHDPLHAGIGPLALHPLNGRTP